MIATVNYQIATYSGEVQVNCNKNDEDDYIIAKAKRIVTSTNGGMVSCRLRDTFLSKYKNLQAGGNASN